ncbi:hypothetical protein KY290_015721 [Solanum tuberosum]|uniref:Uncharacterized protein n=1 Tax=Solanum tuberosum TaxID=4113 RepID=A0ABQ7ULW8_SOLTU|nr:hypothetical protein KY289_037666 [Solanum tuberosum]KAH0640859.1 hypothetical protein KY285_037445 [Solanum tuberosum]KAH0660178.1 hypothetical protein KY289_028926 [Solanum tuberosum]KAH0662706.1 hypothetical protein KY284_027637 [Solanum tuberosum]KAH0667740.1 hypothetical protein KY285_028946 [Solanum tuberosum]
MGHFDPPFLSSSPGSGSGKGQRKDLISKQSLEFSLIRTEPHVRVPPHTAQVAKALSFALGKRFAVAKLTASLSARAKLRPRLLVASGRLIPSPEIQVSTGKDLLIPRGRAGLEASYLLPISPPSFSWVDPMAARKGDLVLYSGDIFPTETRKLPSCPRSHSVNRKGKPTHLSAPLVDRCGFTKRLSTVHSR